MGGHGPHSVNPRVSFGKFEAVWVNALTDLANRRFLCDNIYSLLNEHTPSLAAYLPPPSIKLFCDEAGGCF